MFEIGSYVIYRSEGVCLISDIRNENFGAMGGADRYYILTPLNDPKSTVFVPVSNERLVSMMRPMLSAEEIVRLCRELTDARLEWIAESRARNTRFRDILAVGDRRELIAMIHTINEHIVATRKKGKKPTGTDENALAKAKRLLLEEFGATTDLGNEAELMELLHGERIPHAKQLQESR